MLLDITQKLRKSAILRRPLEGGGPCFYMLFLQAPHLSVGRGRRIKYGKSLPFCERRFHGQLLPVAQHGEFYRIADIQVLKEILYGVVTVELFAIQREDDVFFSEVCFLCRTAGGYRSIVLAFTQTNAPFSTDSFIFAFRLSSIIM